jgi:hypothetical protein
MSIPKPLTAVSANARQKEMSQALMSTSYGHGRVGAFYAPGDRKEKEMLPRHVAHAWRRAAAPAVWVYVTGVRSLVLFPLPTGSASRLTGHPIAAALLLIHLAAFKDHIWPQEIFLPLPSPSRAATDILHRDRGIRRRMAAGLSVAGLLGAAQAVAARGLVNWQAHAQPCQADGGRGESQ